MLVSIITLFPEIFEVFSQSSIIGKAQKNKLLEIRFINLRNWGLGKHKQVDDRPFGGGAGMLLRVDVVYNALNATKIKSKDPNFSEKTVLLDPKGKTFSQNLAYNLSKLDHLILICGHYEGIDHRIDKFIDAKISIGEYILTGGEIPAMVVTDAVARLIPGVLRNPESLDEESFSKNIRAEAPQFTRPFEFMKRKVPEILLSGNHSKIKAWKISKSKK